MNEVMIKPPSIVIPSVIRTPTINVFLSFNGIVIDAQIFSIQNQGPDFFV